MRPEINNPAWDFIKDVPHDELMSRFDDGRFTPTNFEMPRPGSRSCRAYRDEVTALWTWAIPDPGVLNFLYDYLRDLDLSVVEIGAGNGYWAYLMSQMGVDVNAYDIAPMGHAKTWFETVDTPNGNGRRRSALEEAALRGHEAKEWHPVTEAGVEALDLPENHDRALFLCWPPYNIPMATGAVRRFKGDLIFYIGEEAGGCTADDTFFDLMGAGGESWWDQSPTPATPALFKEIDAYPMVQWSGIHDYLRVYERITEEER